jgi:hypothetical protein
MSLIQIKAQDRHIARKGDLIGLYGNKKRKFKLLVALGTKSTTKLKSGLLTTNDHIYPKVEREPDFSYFF